MIRRQAVERSDSSQDMMSVQGKSHRVHTSSRPDFDASEVDM